MYLVTTSKDDWDFLARFLLADDLDQFFKGIDGKSIDFDDFEPSLTPASEPVVADCPFFHVEKVKLTAPVPAASPGDFSIVACVE